MVTCTGVEEISFPRGVEGLNTFSWFVPTAWRQTVWSSSSRWKRKVDFVASNHDTCGKDLIVKMQDIQIGGTPADCLPILIRLPDLGGECYLCGFRSTSRQPVDTETKTNQSGPSPSLAGPLKR